MSSSDIEELGDYLLARGRIDNWRIRTGKYRDYFIVHKPGGSYKDTSEHPTDYVRTWMQMPMEEMPRELARQGTSINWLARMYYEERLKG
jgi:hypothetical protein